VILHRRSSRAFSLIELVVVIAVTLVLTGILMPALSGLRDHADRVISGSNMRQIGMGMTMYSTDNLGRLPYSALLHSGDPACLHEMMVTYVQPDDSQIQQYLHNDGGKVDDGDETFQLNLLTRGFDGIGLLYITGYTAAPDIFYCPAHRGDHPLDRYANRYEQPSGLIYGNYQYRGDIDIDQESGVRRSLTLEQDADRVFLTDGMRTKRDFNHRWGYNSLLGDGSVWWRSDLGERIYQMLPDGKVPGEDVDDLYEQLWELIDKPLEFP
jgi:type II secretory pathway pseudopilin PulG